MPEFKETVDFTGEVVRISDKALLMQLDEVEEPVWLPFSQICDSSELGKQSKAGDKGEVTISEWIAIEKELV